MNTNLIAIAGADNSGKDTTAKMINYIIHNRHIENNGTYFDYKNYKIKKFADLPRKLFNRITGIDFHALDRPEKESKRQQFIDFCESCKVIFGKDVWAKSLFKNYIAEDLWIITDLRFETEYDHVKYRSGVTIFIDSLNHAPKEISNKQFDFIIYNNDDILDLQWQVEQILIKLKLI